IALHESSLFAMPPGALVEDIFNGTEPGNFGWLTWRGSPSAPILIRSLTAPGDSAGYLNPSDPDDPSLSIGDWVQASPGLANAAAIRDALDALLGQDIVVPVWDVSSGQGATTYYRVTAFALIRLAGYSLPNHNRISAHFLTLTTCP
ncbi:MAG TPA: hypothetical protein VFN74_20380, partial [Chloroflexota bacterium]|nr:hypothetical protein [Chloroflexota bacterium]